MLTRVKLIKNSILVRRGMLVGVLLMLSLCLSNFPVDRAYAGENDVCRGVAIDRETISGIKQEQIFEYERQAIFPVDSSIKIYIPKSANNVPGGNLEFGLYASVDGKNGWVKRAGDLLLADQSGSSLRFDINRYTVIDSGAFNIIPGGLNSWYSGRINFKVVAEFDIQEDPDQTILCNFSLGVSNQCSDYSGYNRSQTEDRVAIGFGQDSLVPGGNQSNFRFSRGNNGNFNNITNIGSNSFPETKVFGLNRSELPAFFDSGQNIQLQYNHAGSEYAPVCEFFFVPENKDFINQLNACSVKPVLAGANFDGRIAVDNPPDIILDVNGKDWINTGTKTFAGGLSRSVIARLAVFPRGSVTGAFSYPTAVSGIERIRQDAYENYCTGSEFGRSCKNIDPPNSSVEQFALVTEREQNYVAMLTYFVQYYSNGTLSNYEYYTLPGCSYNFTYGDDGITKIDPVPSNPPDYVSPENPLQYSSTRKICGQIGSAGEEAYDNCESCLNGTGKYADNGPGSWTALGCIPANTGGFVQWLLGPFMGIAGGIAFLLIIKGGYQIMFSQGNQETIADGRDTIVAAISGLIVIILSVAILEIIGVDILNLPGFSR